tara:strand:+ start:1836 stop:2198 length:363 start_codon:yes stop_codon:yes gene_type:complete
MENPNYKDLEIVENKYPNRDYNIMVSIPEFTCVCPKTSLPDFATIEINYVPQKFIVELKSLKLYINKFRNLGIFHEHVTNQILDDFKQACSPKNIIIQGIFKPRGGISTTVKAVWPKPIK